ncbi:30S ribosomal protein S6 [Trichlorobacter ammonificans]|uniref:Small ribosomal subunit protein bS6 n=1 Tax=Trichlorobacter ammonificans TaxID=2916410 RepID=A0ABM9D6X3_9BACT|nr:30S ribosomal protein S6 [Trichlorobacter ammonificans]CAH2030955.1 30S ribosomal protein S6 [Trichlorobacter ammonificans]
MRKYETIFILQPDLADDDIKTITGKAQDVIAAYNGALHRLDDWGARKLAYPIRKFPRGRYFYLRFDGGAELVAELERRLRLDEKVLRYLSVNITNEPEKKVAERKPAADVSEAPEVSEAAETAAE